MTAKLGVSAAFELSWERLDADTQELGCLVSLFALALIPWSLVEEVSEELCLPGLAMNGIAMQAVRDLQQEPESLAEDLLQDLRESLETSRSALIKLNLLMRAGDGMYRTHQLVKQFFSEKLDSSVQSINFKRLVSAKIVEIIENLPQVPVYSEIQAVALFVPHLEEVVKELFVYLEDDAIFISFNGLMNFYHTQGLYKICETWCSYFLGKIKSSKNNISRALLPIVYNRLALAYQKQGQYNKAEPVFLQVLEDIKKETNNKNDLNTASVLNNLGLLYIDLKRFKKAESHLIEALTIKENLLKQIPQGLETDILISYADTLNDLGWLYTEIGLFERAEPLLLKAFEIRKEKLNITHPYLAISINNLGVLYFKQNYFDKVKSLYLEALRIRKNSLSESHPDVATSLHNLAELHLHQHEFDEAEKLWQKALKISIKTLGEQHPDTVLYRRMLQLTSLLQSASPETLEEISEIAAIYGMRFEAKQQKNGKKGGKGFQNKSRRTFEEKRQKRKPNVMVSETWEEDFLYSPEFYHRLLPVPRNIFSLLGVSIKEHAAKSYQELGRGIVCVEIKNSSYEEIHLGYLKEEHCIDESKRSPSKMWDEILLYLEIYYPKDYFIILILDMEGDSGVTRGHYCFMLPLY